MGKRIQYKVKSRKQKKEDRGNEGGERVKKKRIPKKEKKMVKVRKEEMGRSRERKKWKGI